MWGVRVVKTKGAHKEKRLSAAFVRSVTAPGAYPDGQCLYLRVDPSGAKRWFQRLTINGSRRDIGLGSASLVSLAEARDVALENRRLAKQGHDPLTARRAEKEIPTFEGAARVVHDMRSGSWRSGKHADQWLNTLEGHAFPVLGRKRVDKISRADVLQTLTPIWNDKPETARRVKQRISTVMDWVIAKGWRGDNPVVALKTVLPKQDRSNKRHHKALPYDEVQASLATIQGSNASPVTKLAFEFLVLTATRSNETRLARWSEIDLAKAEWVIPGERMKAKQPHRVPLTRRCLQILEDVKDYQIERSDFIFPTPRGKVLSDSTFSKLLRELGINAVPHGYRSSFRDWGAEQTLHQREVMEAALAHVIRDKAEAAYARSTLFEKRRHLMDDWSRYLGNSLS